MVTIEIKDCFVVIRVRDNGVGIPKEAAEHVFKAFIQADKSLNRENEGTGL